MSDKPDIEAIRKRNEERKAGCAPRKVGRGFDDHYICVIHGHLQEVPADIDALLAEIERLRLDE